MPGRAARRHRLGLRRERASDRVDRVTPSGMYVDVGNAEHFHGIGRRAAIAEHTGTDLASDTGRVIHPSGVHVLHHHS